MFTRKRIVIALTSVALLIVFASILPGNYFSVSQKSGKAKMVLPSERVQSSSEGRSPLFRVFRFINGLIPLKTGRHGVSENVPHAKPHGKSNRSIPA